MARVSKAIVEAVRSVVEPLEGRRLLTTVTLTVPSDSNNFYASLNNSTGNIDFFVNDEPGGTPVQSVPASQVSRVVIQHSGDDGGYLNINTPGKSFALEVADDTLGVDVTGGTVTIDTAPSLDTLSVGANATLIMAGANAGLNTYELNVNGTLQHSAGAIQASWLTIGSIGAFIDAGGSIGSASGVTIENSGTFKASFAGSLAGTTGTFHNAGHFIEDVGAGHTNTIGMSFVANSLNFNLVTGTLRLNNLVQPYRSNLTIDGTAGTLSVANLDLGGDYHQTGGTLALDGSFEIRGRAGLADVRFSGGTLNVGQWMAVSCFVSGQTTFHQSGGVINANAVTIGQASSDGGVWDQTGGTNHFNSLDISPWTAATVSSSYNLSGGSTTINSASIGIGGTGVFNLSGTGDLTVTNEYVGSWGGNGTFNQTGGTANVGQLDVGYLSAAGTYRLSGGMLTVQNERIAVQGWQSGQTAGTFVQTAGTHNVAGTLAVADSGNAAGEYDLNGGSLNTADLTIGSGGIHGSFVQTNGDTMVTGTLVVGGWNAVASAIMLSGGSITAMHNAYIGYVSPGTLNQTSGTFSVANNLYVSGDGADGDNPDGHGTYNLSGTGHLSTSNTFVGYGSNGTFNQSGGIYDTNFLVYNGPSGSTGTVTKAGGDRLNKAGNSLESAYIVNVLHTSAIGDGVVDEGSPYSLHLSATTNIGYNAVTAWGVNWGDSANEGFPGTQATAQHTYLSGGVTRTIQASAFDGHSWQNMDPLHVLIHSVPASIASIAPISVDAGQPVQLSTTFTDPGTGQTHTASIDWGDGRTSSSTLFGLTLNEFDHAGTISSTHTFQTHGTYTAILTIKDSTGAVSSVPITVHVNYVAPTFGLSMDSSPIVAGQAAHLDMKAFGPEASGITSWKINWGDGTETIYPYGPTAASANDAVWTQPHTYASSGSYTIHAWATDAVQSLKDAGTLTVTAIPLVVLAGSSNASIGATAKIEFSPTLEDQHIDVTLGTPIGDQLPLTAFQVLYLTKNEPVPMQITGVSADHSVVTFKRQVSESSPNGPLADGWY
ncbi:MAG: hypothetical protein JWM57_251 [Phycisphaerales bacterium]|nr:hypothetical protein [Phycisphaerales bacterium]